MRSSSLDPPDDHNHVKEAENKDLLIAAEEYVRRRAGEPGSWLSPEAAVFVYRLTIAENGAALYGSITDRQLAHKLRNQTGDRTWDLELAGEARELVKGWGYGFIRKQCE